jgi:ferric-dicitrate binding protein FerR (iron transport regulator)
MNSNEPQRELLVRYLDGKVTLEERLGVVELLRTDREAREFLREVAEQSVMVADLERTALGRKQELFSRTAQAGENHRTVVLVRFRPWRRVLAAAALIMVLAAVAAELWQVGQQARVRVSKVTGASQVLGSRGATENTLEAGARLSAGDTLETRSCDAWIELEMGDGAKMTIGGHSTLRILEGEGNGMHFSLVRGNLWASPAQRPTKKTLVIQTPTVVLEARSAQFDLQTSAAETMLRINEGSARVKRKLDGSVVDVSRGHQVTAALGRKEPLAVLPQPMPINHWACDLGRAPEVILGQWLPPRGTERARLGAAPLLWPIPNREPVMLYAVALSVSRSSDRPVQLQAGSKLVFRGRTERAQTVRFGFSTQKMRGVFAGKFEMDVRPDSLGPAGQTWEITLPVSEFRALQPQLSFSPEGLELTDVYALTIKEDAGLEVNHIELVRRMDSKERSP